MDVNGEAIFGTRPWKIYGEGPTLSVGDTLAQQRGKESQFTPADIRFTTKSSTIYAILMAWPEHEASIKSLGSNSPLTPGKISDVELLGNSGRLQWKQGSNGLTVWVPPHKPCDYAYVLKISV